MLTLYVEPLHIPALRLNIGVAHGEAQSVGEFTIIDVAHDPFVAVIVTLVPTAIPVTMFPEIIPELAVITAPTEALKAKLKVPFPEQAP